MKRSAFDELYASLPAALQRHMGGRPASARTKLSRDDKRAKAPKSVSDMTARHIPLSLAERRLVERAAAIVEKAPELYARAALIAQSRAVVELHEHGHFKAAKERG